METQIFCLRGQGNSCLHIALRPPPLPTLQSPAEFRSIDGFFRSCLPGQSYTSHCLHCSSCFTRNLLPPTTPSNHPQQLPRPTLLNQQMPFAATLPEQVFQQQFGKMRPECLITSAAGSEPNSGLRASASARAACICNFRLFTSKCAVTRVEMQGPHSLLEEIRFVFIVQSLPESSANKTCYK